MKFSILSLFPEYFSSPFKVSMIKRAIDSGAIEIDLVNIRDFAKDKHKTVDDKPFGGGPGMLMKPEPLVDSIRSRKTKNSHVVHLSPKGKKLNAEVCRRLSTKSHLILVCGHYEGIDERVVDLEVDELVSIGDFVVTSGCPAAVVVLDAVVRFIPGVLGNPKAADEDSHENDQLEPAQYTRPRIFEGIEVPEVLLSGHHKEIEGWKNRNSQKFEK